MNKMCAMTIAPSPLLSKICRRHRLPVETTLAKTIFGSSDLPERSTSPKTMITPRVCKPHSRNAPYLGHAALLPERPKEWCEHMLKLLDVLKAICKDVLQFVEVPGNVRRLQGKDLRHGDGPGCRSRFPNRPRAHDKRRRSNPHSAAAAALGQHLPKHQCFATSTHVRRSYVRPRVARFWAGFLLGSGFSKRASRETASSILGYRIDT